MLNKLIGLYIILFLAPSLLASENQGLKSNAVMPIEAQRCFNSSFELPSYRLSGVGINQDKQQARVDAYQEISQQLSVEVSSETTSLTQRDQHDISNSFTSQAQLISQNKLTGAQLECEYYSPENKHFYVLYSIDKRPPLLQIAQKLIDSWQGERPSSIHWVGNKHLLRSNAIKKLTPYITAHSSENTTKKQVNVGLNYHNKSWYITLNLISQRIENDDVIEFFKLPAQHQQHQLSIVKPSKNNWLTTRQLKELDEFKFRLKAKKNSFYQILNIYQDGRVSDLTGIKKIPSKELIFPENGIFEAALLLPNERTVDIYLAIVSDNAFSPLTLEQLQAWQGVVKSKDSYQLANLLSWLAENEEHVEISAIQVITLPK